MIPTTVVIPTTRRASLERLLAALAHGRGPAPQWIVVVDDSPDGGGGVPLHRPALPPLTVHRSYGRGPAAARNVGWRHARSAWVSFLDDDVVPDDDWFERLGADIADASLDIAGIQGRIRVPLPGQDAGFPRLEPASRADRPRTASVSSADRRPTDSERNTAALADAAWITADMTYRRTVLAAVGGFDERFGRAYREDADLALRVLEHGGRLVRGSRAVSHPPHHDDGWASVRRQVGNADDVLMKRLHGRDWRERARAPRGRLRRHLAVTAAGLGAVGLALAGRRRAAIAAATVWAAGVAEFAAARIAPGPKTLPEVRQMLLTSAVIPAAASWHSVRGTWRHRRARPWRGLPEAVLFDRDGTLVHDVPYNSDPARVAPVPGVRQALDRLRQAGVRVGVVTNQSGVARGLISRTELDAVNGRVEFLLGPFDDWQMCVHGPDDGCACRKPEPGLVSRACVGLSVDPSRCVVVGDTGADIAAARAAGAVGILVPNSVTLAEEVAAAPLVCDGVPSAVDRLIGGAW